MEKLIKTYWEIVITPKYLLTNKKDISLKFKWKATAIKFKSEYEKLYFDEFFIIKIPLEEVLLK